MPAKRTKRVNGDGSVYPRGTGFEAAITVRGQRRTARARTKPEAEAALRRLRALRDTGQLPRKDGTTTGEYLDFWLTQRRAELRYSTWRRYSELVAHAKPIIGNVPLVKLAPLHLQDLYAKKRDEGLSAQTTLHLHRALHKAFADAETWELVDRNVAHRVKAPTVRPPAVDVLTPPQVVVLIDAAGEHIFGVLFVLAVTTGLRLGELLGLHWSDLDLGTERSAIVKGSMQRTEKGRAIGETKTEQSRRTVELLDVARDLLVAERRRQRALRMADAREWPDPELVFTDEHGAALNPDRVRRQFRTFLRANGLPVIKFKNLRHTFATLHLDTGTPDKVVSEALGHSRTSTTNQFYRRVDRRHQRAAATRLDVLLRDAAATVAGGVAGGVAAGGSSADAS